jgi:hypothetical protein
MDDAVRLRDIGDGDHGLVAPFSALPTIAILVGRHEDPATVDGFHFGHAWASWPVMSLSRVGPHAVPFMRAKAKRNG